MSKDTWQPVHQENGVWLCEHGEPPTCQQCTIQTLLAALKQLWECAGTAGQKEALAQAEAAYAKATGERIYD